MLWCRRFLWSPLIGREQPILLMLKEQVQLETIAMAAMKTGKILWIGPVGSRNFNGILSKKPTLTVVGSISSKPWQLQYCRENGVSVSLRYEDDLWNASGRPCCSWCGDLFEGRTGRRPYRCFCRQDYGFCRLWSWTWHFNRCIGEFTKQTLSGMVPVILKEAAVNGCSWLVVMAIAVIHQLEASGSHIERELVPGFVLGRLLGGSRAGLPIVTKAGAFGTEEDIYNCIKNWMICPIINRSCVQIIRLKSAWPIDDKVFLTIGRFLLSVLLCLKCMLC